MSSDKRHDKGREPRLGTLRDTFTGEGAESGESPLKQGPDERREKRLKLQRTASKLTPEMRVHHCLWTHHAASVDLVKRGDDPRFLGVQTCGSVWSCPVCAARISETRRGELQQLLAWTKERGIIPMMMTLTARHRGRALDPLVESLALAKRRMSRRRAWERLKEEGQVVGTVSVRESTYGDENGWHPHYHVIVLMSVETEAEAARLLEPLRREWLDCLRKEGLTGTSRRAFDVRGAAAVAAYGSKHGRDDGGPTWDMAAEMTQARNKSGRKGGRSPFQILRDVHDGDEASIPLWQEYARGMHGRRQIVWSNGLKATVGIDEIEDEAAAEGEEYTEEEDETVASWSSERWRHIRHLRGEILTAARHGGAEAVARVVHDDHDDPVIEEPPPVVFGGLRDRALAILREKKEAAREPPVE